MHGVVVQLRVMYIIEWRKWCWRDIRPQWCSLTCKNIAQGMSAHLTNINLCVLLCAVWVVLMVTDEILADLYIAVETENPRSICRLTHCFESFEFQKYLQNNVVVWQWRISVQSYLHILRSFRWSTVSVRFIKVIRISKWCSYVL
jgi:hypothetical protein